MPRLQESLRAAGSYISENSLQSTGIGLVADTINARNLREARARIQQENGWRKVLPVAKLAAPLAIATIEVISPNFTRGLEAAAQKEEVGSARGTPKDWRFQRDYAIAFFGLAVDSLYMKEIFLPALNDPSFETVAGALVLKTAYNSFSHALLGLAGVSSLQESLNAPRT